MSHPSGPVVAPPAFRQPDSPWTSPDPNRNPPPAAAPPADPAPATDSQPSSSPPRGGRLVNLLRPNRDGSEATRTDTSSPDGPTDRPPAAKRTPIKVDAKVIEDAAEAIIGVAILAAVWAVRVRSRHRRTLRRPDESDTADAAEALGRILHRRANLAAWAPDVIDAAIIIGAAGTYAGRGPLTVPLAPVVPVESPTLEEDQ